VRAIQVDRLGVTDVDRARSLFAVIADVFELAPTRLSDAYLRSLLARAEFWALAATVDGEIAGGLTAHTLALTRSEESEVFLYDLAVRPDFQRQGVGRALVAALREQAMAAGINVVFVPADNEDTHALEFYRAVGGTPAAVTIFTFAGRTAL